TGNPKLETRNHSLQPNASDFSPNGYIPTGCTLHSASLGRIRAPPGIVLHQKIHHLVATASFSVASESVSRFWRVRGPLTRNPKPETRNHLKIPAARHGAAAAPRDSFARQLNVAREVWASPSHETF